MYKGAQYSVWDSGAGIILAVHDMNIGALVENWRGVGVLGDILHLQEAKEREREREREGEMWAPFDTCRPFGWSII